MHLQLKRLLVLVLVIFLITSPLLVFSVSASYNVHISPSDDSWVEAEYPNGNHGSETSLRVKSDSRTRRSYLKFDLGSIPEGKTVTSIKLYLYCTYADFNPSVEVYVHETGDGWSEASITWNNAPAVGALVTSTTINGTGRYYCWDITPYGQAEYVGDKTLSVVVKLLLDDPSQNNPDRARYFASKEYSGTAQDPYLEVVYEDTSPTALFTYSPTYPVANDTVVFNASESYDPDGYITSYMWDFGDGNITTVAASVIEHEYMDYGNYTVTLTVTDNNGLVGTQTQIVEVVDPEILQVSILEGTYVSQNTGDPWIDKGWLLNQTGNSWTFTLKIKDTSCWLKSYDTHLIVALNDAAYNNLQSLTINGTSIPKSAFKNGKPKPYGVGYWPNCVYPTWFNDTYINVGTIYPKSYKILVVSVTFSDATNARMHFDAYGSVYSGTPCSWWYVTWSPSSEDSTVIYQAAPVPLSVSISPSSATLDLGQYVTFTSSVSGGTPPYSYQWYLNGSAVAGANQSSWIFTPSATGYYLVHLNVTDNVGSIVKSNVAEVTVNPPLSVSIQPMSSVIVLGESVNFTSTVSGGTPPYNYKWYVNDTEVPGANGPTWTFTPASTGYYLVYLKVTDGASAAALSDEAEVTVNPKTYTLKIESTSGGTTNPAPGTYIYNEGTNVQVTAIPNANYKFVYWELNGSNVGSANPINIVMNASYTLKAHFALVTYTLTITASAGGTTNPAPGTYIYEAGSYASVTAVPAENYMFSHWVLDGSPAGSANPINVLMDKNRTLHAVFSIINYTLTITATSGGTTNPSPGTYVYASGSVVEVTAFPNVNYKFVHWEIDGANITSNPITIVMNKSYTLHAVFQLLTYKLTILSSSGGTTSPAPGTYFYTNGTYASVTAIPDTHYLLDYWLLDGSPAGSANPISVLMMDDHTLQPIFTLRNYTLTITATVGGTTNPSPGTYTYSAGTVVQVAAIPNMGYSFAYWVLDGSPAGSDNPISVLMNQNRSLHAVFYLTNYTLTITASAGGTTNPEPGTYVYASGSDVLVTAIPNLNYRFVKWLLDGNDVGAANPYTVHMDANHTLHAVFEQLTYQLTILSSSGGTTNPAAGTYTYVNGTSVSVTAIPDTYYVLNYWLLDGENAGSANPINVLMTANHTLQPIFAHVNYTLTISATAGGTTNPSPGVYTYSGGASVQVTALPSAGYRFDHWVLDGSPAGSANPITVLMDSNHSLEAVFAETHTLVITVSAGGTTNPAPGTYNYDVPTYVTVTAVPYVNYRFDHWVYDGEDIGSANPVTVYVGSNHTLHAVFTLITRTLKIETTAGGTTNPAPGTYTYTNGTTVQVTAIANANYVFDHWELDTVNVGSANPYSVLMSADHTLKAVFVYSPPPPPLSVSINPLSATIKVGESVIFTSSVSGGIPPYHYQWYLNGNPVSGANSNSWTFSPVASGIYYVYLNVTDAQGNSAQSSVARITVTEVTPPVGGFTIPLPKPDLLVQLTGYAMLMAFFSVALSLIRRKRK